MADMINRGGVDKLFTLVKWQKLPQVAYNVVMACSTSVTSRFAKFSIFDNRHRASLYSFYLIKD